MLGWFALVLSTIFGTVRIYECIVSVARGETRPERCCRELSTAVPSFIYGYTTR